jgi:hypothetical protein
LSIIKDELTKTLVREGVSERDARTILEENWTEGENKNPKHLKSKRCVYVLSFIKIMIFK